MKPLRETEGGSPLLERAKALLEATPPLPESRERMLRVRRALDAERGVWVRLRRLPAAALAALVLFFGASAFAAVRVVIEVVQGGVGEAVELEAGAAPAQRKGRGKARVKVPAEAAPASVEAPAGMGVLVQPGDALTAEGAAPASTLPAAAPGASAETTSGDASGSGASETNERGGGGAGRSARSARRASGSAVARAHAHDTSPEALARATDSELVHRAAKALRSEHDPALAARLLEAHRARSPSGPLAEEALSLQIEALTALGSPRAKVLAREYVARYPGGRYAAVARRALGDAAQ